MEPQPNQPTSTQPTPTETGVITTSQVPIEPITESHIASPDVSNSAQDTPKAAHTQYVSTLTTTTSEYTLTLVSARGPDTIIPEPAPAYSAAPVDKPVQIEPIPQVAKVTPLNLLREQPTWIDCPYCQRRAMTRVGHEDSSATM